MKTEKIKKPKFFLSLLLVLLILLCSCGKTNGNEVSDAAASEAASAEASSETLVTDGLQSDEITGYTDSLVNNGSSGNLSDNANEQQSDSADDSLSQQKSGASQSDGAQSVQETEESNTVSAQQTQPEEICVTFSVDCKNALGSEYLSNSAFDNVVAAGGVILPETAITVKSGTSVMKALKAVLKENNIAFSITSSGYVRSINGLAEFDCGNTSGWMYLVNGVLPSVSTKSYILQDGDKVEFRYTCTPGDVQ